MKDEKLENMKKEYEEIQIPKELKNRVTDAVERGKSMNQKEKKVIPFQRALVRSGQVAAAALVTVTVLANSNAQVALAMEKIPVIGAITKVVTFRDYERQDGRMEAEIKTPKIEAEEDTKMSAPADEINRSVEEYTNQLIAEYESDVKENGGDMAKGVTVNYEVITDSEKLFSLKIRTGETMASGAESVKIYHIDKTTGTVLHLKDLFAEGDDYRTRFSEEVRAQMREQMAADEEKQYFLDAEEGEVFESIREDQTFYINEDGKLVLVFDEYEVAPGYMGMVEFVMPEELKI